MLSTYTPWFCIKKLVASIVKHDQESKHYISDIVGQDTTCFVCVAKYKIQGKSFIIHNIHVQASWFTIFWLKFEIKCSEKLLEINFVCAD
jgi:hypothetical protein